MGTKRSVIVPLGHSNSYTGIPTSMSFSNCNFIPFRTKVKFLRQTTEREPDEAVKKEPAASDKKAQPAGPRILCRSCLYVITRPADRIQVDGLHHHTFANPYGLVYEISCFRNAEGSVTVGPDTEEFTWFAGHRWRVCLCGACRVHLGWRFASISGDTFYGLIFDRLIEPLP
jgi:hypothetical protein